jgi:hypothetical protein
MTTICIQLCLLLAPSLPSPWTNVANQSDWRYCGKCHALFYNVPANKGRCAAGSSHEAIGYTFVLPVSTSQSKVPGTPTAQDAWAICLNCRAMFYDGYADKGKCAAGGGHKTGGRNYVLSHDVAGIAGRPVVQNNWRYCGPCHALFYNGYADKGRCAAGGGHQAMGYNFVLPTNAVRID